MAIFAPGNKPVWESEGAQTNPTASQVMADTGALAEGLYDIRVICGATAAGSWVINRRNAANGADVGDQPVIYTAANTSQWVQVTMSLEAGERVRVTSGGLTGSASALITAEPLL